MKTQYKLGIGNSKYLRFQQWCKQVGIIAPKLEYPFVFDDGLLGVRCTETIEYHEAHTFIPYNVLIDLYWCRTEPALMHIYFENPHIFAP